MAIAAANESNQEADGPRRGNGTTTPAPPATGASGGDPAAGAGDPAPEIGGAVFFPATSTNPNNYNKGHLNCPFLPLTEVHVDKTVDPSAIPANATTPLTFTITVTNDGASPGRGVMLEDIVLPGWLTNVTAAVDADPGVTWTVESTNPLVVRIPRAEG